MGILRLAILGFLFMTLYRLLKGMWQGKSSAGAASGPSPESNPLPSQDVLVQDPVCKTYIPKQQSVTLIEDGQTFHFCSDACCRKFLTDKNQQGASP